MKKISLVIVVIVILAIFNRCSQITSLSGKYVNEQNSSEYLKFSGESTVVLYSDGEKITGTYSIGDDTVMLVFGAGENTAIEFFAIKDKNTLIYNLFGVAFVKRTFWNYYWKRILLFGIIGLVILGVIGNIIEKKEKKNGKGAEVVDDIKGDAKDA